jgi:hypothetical protein
MRAVLAFGAGFLSLLVLWVLAPLYLATAVGHTARPTTVAILFGSLLLVAAVAAIAYFCGVWLFRRRPAPLSSYLLGLVCGVVAVGCYELLGSRFIHFPIGLYGRVVGPVLAGFVGFLGSLLSARGAS